MKKKEPDSLDLAREAAAHLKILEESYKGKSTDPRIQQTITNLTAALSKAIKDLQEENPVEAQKIAAAALQEAQTRYQKDYTFGDATKRQQIESLKKLSKETAEAAKTQQTTVQPNTQQPDQPNTPTTPGQQQPQGQEAAQTNATPNIQQTATQPAQANTQTIQPGQQPPQDQGVAQTNTTSNTQQTATQPVQANTQTTQQEQQQAQRAAERDASIAAAQKANKENLAKLQAAEEAKVKRATQVSGAAKIIVDTKIKQNKIQADTEQREVMEQALQDALNVNLNLDPKEYYGIMSKAYNDNLIKRAGDKAQRQGKPRAIAEAAVRNKIREKNAAKGAIAQSNISYKKIKLDADINRVTADVASDFEQLKKGFDEAKEKYQHLNEARKNKVNEIQQVLNDGERNRPNELFQKALNNAKLELLNKRKLGVKDINDPTKFTQKEWAKFNKEATSLAKKKLEGIKKQAELGNSGSWFDFSSSFNKLETAKGKLEDLSGRLARITSNLNKLQGQINKAEQDKKALAGILGVESKYTTIQNFKVGVQKLRARFNARFNNDDEELKRIELFEGLVKKIDKYEKDFRETSKEFNKTKSEYNACKKDFDNRYAERNKHYHDKVVPALAKLDNAPSQEILTALQNKDTKYKLEQQQTQSKIDRIKESMTGDYTVGSTTAGSVVADTHKTAAPEKQNNGLGTPPN